MMHSIHLTLMAFVLKIFLINKRLEGLVYTKKNISGSCNNISFFIFINGIL